MAPTMAQRVLSPVRQIRSFGRIASLLQDTPAILQETPVPQKTAEIEVRDLPTECPPYPYGPSRWFKQSNKGLYGGAVIQFGNNVSHKFENKTRRNWHPNIQRKKLYSVALDRNVRVRVSTRVLRTIDKAGGLDNYLLGHKPARIKDLGVFGWELRWRIMHSDKVKKEHAFMRAQLGLPHPYDELLPEEELERIEEFDKELDRMEDEEEAPELVVENADITAESPAKGW